MTIAERATAPTATEYVHLNGRLTPFAEASVSIYDHGFLYGDGAFEGIRVYEGNIFRLDDHVARLFRSAKALGIDLKTTRQAITDAIVATVATNRLASGYIRVTVSRGIGLGLDPSHIDLTPTIAISTNARMRLYAPEMYVNGLDVITASTRVPPSVCVDPQIKSLGRYVNNIMAKQEAARVGAGEALMLNMQGNVAEATGDNIFVLSGGVVRTPPTHQGALPGITRAAVMDIAGEFGIEVREQELTLYDVVNADEVFLTGTAAEIVPVAMCDNRRIGSGVAGDVTKRLMERFQTLARAQGTTVPTA
ncbi:MAG: branched-chain-amino-acid transaminase [Armatimonadetes bacterium]|nr:branched-chain-amino-acid transaminase [Armatimonadota bacterium]MDE2207801.1 branched-chain-amino-acid transaminase [Armatimonadota bacterium]